MITQKRITFLRMIILVVYYIEVLYLHYFFENISIIPIPIAILLIYMLSCISKNIDRDTRDFSLDKDLILKLVVPWIMIMPMALLLYIIGDGTLHP